jgi:hypothetical protein
MDLARGAFDARHVPHVGDLFHHSCILTYYRSPEKLE